MFSVKNQIKINKDPRTEGALLEKQKVGTGPPKTPKEALLRIFWLSRFRYLWIILLLISSVGFALWQSVPDSDKSRLIAKIQNISFKVSLANDAEKKTLLNILRARDSLPLFLDNSPELTKATLEPIDLRIAKIFWSQGWPIDMLIYLLIEEITIYTHGDQPDLGRIFPECRGLFSTAVNDPKDRIHFHCFSTMVQALVRAPGYEPKGTHLQLVDTFVANRIGPVLTRSDVGNLEHLAKLQEKGQFLIEVQSGFQLCEIKRAVSFCLAAPNTCPALPKDRAEACAQGSPSTQSLPGNDGVHRLYFGEVNDPVYSVQVRSLQAMTYFVGEMVRSVGPTHVWVLPSGDARDCLGVQNNEGYPVVPLFGLKKGEPTNPAVSVNYLGEDYWIPSGDLCSKSLQTLSFLTQLLRLYQSHIDFPTSDAVQTVVR